MVCVLLYVRACAAVWFGIPFDILARSLFSLYFTLTGGWAEGPHSITECGPEAQSRSSPSLNGQREAHSPTAVNHATDSTPTLSADKFLCLKCGRRLLMRYVAVTPVRLNGPACWHALCERSSQPAGLTHPQRARRPHMMSMKADHGPRNDCGAYVAQADFVRTAVGKATRRGPQQASVPR